MDFDWRGLQEFMVGDIVAAVRAAAREVPDAPVHRAAVTDFYAQKMLVLWPTVAVTWDRDDRRPAEWSRQFDADEEGDGWAARLTAHAGSSGRQWSVVVEQFFDHVVAAARRATVLLLEEGVGSDDFVVIAADDERDLTTRCLTSEQLAVSYPRIYRRQQAITALRSLSVDHQLASLLATSSESPEDALTAADRVGLLVESGVSAAMVAAEAIARGEGPISLLTKVVYEVGANSEPIVDCLETALRQEQLESGARESIACCLAWLGRLDIVVGCKSTLTDAQLFAAVATPYLSAHKRGPLDYGPLEAALDAVPHLHDALFARLSPTHMFAITAGDLPTVTEALSSRWPVVRRHAAIVTLSIHM